MSENQKSGVDIRDFVTMIHPNEDTAAEENGTGITEPSELTGIQVKFEVDDPEYEQSTSTVSAGLLRSFHAPQAVTTSQSAAEWTGTSSAIRNELRKMVEDKSISSSTTTQNVQNVIENLLKKNENLLAQNDALGYKPHSRRGRPAQEGSKAKDTVFPASGQSVTFATGQQSQGRVMGNGSRPTAQSDQGVTTAQMGQLMRPKSPTRRCAIQEKDKSHFSLALMESRVGNEEGEKIFHVQEHEMVCAISSQTKFLNKEGRLVSSVDINYYWCNFCNYSTTNRTFLMQHVMEHRFHCKHCRYQSFSRADVIHHSVHAHQSFQDTASITMYCTLLSDYLRVQNPSEIQQNHHCKRKDPPQDDDDGGNEPSAKVSKNGVKDKVQKSYSADFDLFDVTVEDLKDRGEEEGTLVVETGSKFSSTSSSSTALSSADDPGSQNSTMVTTLVSQPMSTVTHSSTMSGGQPIITQVFSASTLPPTLAPDISAPAQPASSVQSASTATAGSSSSPTPTPLFPNSVGAGAMQQMRSNLYWSCGYCSFTSTSQSGIKEHSVFQHSGKPHRYVALIKSDGGGHSTPPPTGTGGTDQPVESEAAEESEKTTPPQAEPPELEEPPLLVKQEPMEVEDASVPIRVRFPTPRNLSKDNTILKCFHCSHTSRNLGPLRNHILNRHKGKCLVGLGGVSSKVFMCTRTDCTFRSSSGHTFLSHSQECTPWLTADDSSHPSVAAHLKKCLEATMRVAQENPASPADESGSSATTSSSSQVSSKLFSCLYCKCQITWSKKQTKQHVLQCHSSKFLVMRDVKAHRNRKRSCVFFCRWCPWEGKTSTEHNAHRLICPPAQDDGQPCEFLYDDGGEACLLDRAALEKCTGENGDKGTDVMMISDSADDLGPPDITKDVEDIYGSGPEIPDHTYDRPHTRSASSSADTNPQCKTFLSGGKPLLYISDPNGIDSDDSDEFPQSESCYKDKEHFSNAQRKIQHKNKCGTKKDNMPLFQSAYDVRKKVKHFQNKPTQSFSKSKLKLNKKKMTVVQCYLCRFETDSLRSLKLHMQNKHDQYVSFSFRSLYHSFLHLKCRFFVCPSLDCSMYRHNEADVVSHYRHCHRSHPHEYLVPSYSPAPVKYPRRMHKQLADEPRKPRRRHSPASSHAGVSVGKLMDTEAEGQYLCLYCDHHYYCDTIGRMKVHHLDVHPSIPIIIRDVPAFRSKRRSRVFVCESVQCDFSTYLARKLEEHVATEHSDQWDPDRDRQVMQCTSCGWVTSDNSLLHGHLTTVHAGEAGATMVTLNQDDACL